MLCGELVRSPLGSVGFNNYHSIISPSSPWSAGGGPRSPYVALFALCRGMAALTAPVDDEDIFLGEYFLQIHFLNSLIILIESPFDITQLVERTNRSRLKGSVCAA